MSREPVGGETRSPPHRRSESSGPSVRTTLPVLLALTFGVGAWTAGAAQEGSTSGSTEVAEHRPQEMARDTAVFAGGCFWCMEPPYDELDGVLETISGYAGGHVESPSYEEVTAGGTGHREAVMVVFDPTRVEYSELLNVFWRNVDPLDDGGQFCDRGFSYTTAIFPRDEAQLQRARASKASIQDRFLNEVVTPVVVDAAFYPAETYHQDYYEKNPARYKFYRWSCGRDDRLEELWGEGELTTRTNGGAPERTSLLQR